MLVYSVAPSLAKKVSWLAHIPVNVNATSFSFQPQGLSTHDAPGRALDIFLCGIFSEK